MVEFLFSPLEKTADETGGRELQEQRCICNFSRFGCGSVEAERSASGGMRMSCFFCERNFLSAANLHFKLLFTVLEEGKLLGQNFACVLFRHNKSLAQQSWRQDKFGRRDVPRIQGHSLQCVALATHFVIPGYQIRK